MRELLNPRPIEKGFSFAAKSTGTLQINDQELAVVKKMLNPNTELSVRQGEIQASCSASDLGIGAKVYDAEYPDSALAGGLIMEALQATPMTLEEMSHPEVLAALMRTLQVLHREAKPESFPQTRSVVGQISEDLRMIQVFFPEVMDKLSPLVRALIAMNTALSERSNLCVCHNDLQQDNLFKIGDDIRLIDWEFAGVGNPYVELGILVNLFDIRGACLDDLLGEYAKQHPSQHPKAELYLGQQIHLMLVATFSLLMLGMMYPAERRSVSVDLSASSEQFPDSASILRAFYSESGFAFTDSNLHLLASVCFQELHTHVNAAEYKQYLQQVQAEASDKLPHLQAYYQHVNEVTAVLEGFIPKPSPKPSLARDSFFGLTPFSYPPSDPLEASLTL